MKREEEEEEVRRSLILWMFPTNSSVAVFVAYVALFASQGESIATVHLLYNPNQYYWHH